MATALLEPRAVAANALSRSMAAIIQMREFVGKMLECELYTFAASTALVGVCDFAKSLPKSLFKIAGSKT